MDTERYTLDDYQRDVGQFAVELPYDQAIAHGVLGLCGEAGEIAEKLKKFYRDGRSLDREDIKKELGDVLWYVAYVSRLIDYKLGDTAYTNYKKLADRAFRGVLSGSGDNR